VRMRACVLASRPIVPHSRCAAQQPATTIRIVAEYGKFLEASDIDKNGKISLQEFKTYFKCPIQFPAHPPSLAVESACTK